MTISCEFAQAIALFGTIFGIIDSLTSLCGSVFATAVIVRQDRYQVEIIWFALASVS
ncbi:hypothetical protein QUB68_00245 [Microcoleus sp. A006_D1]|uniref:hypothetical protein n=1 Tax=Microcoleus sp. A006_D1 TaxID=3055267 RepID=UPI002FD0405F